VCVVLSPLLGKVVGSVSGLVHRFVDLFVYDQDRNNRTVPSLKVGGLVPSEIVLELVLNRKSLSPVLSSAAEVYIYRVIVYCCDSGLSQTPD
jgi:hypothetical protein